MADPYLRAALLTIAGAAIVDAVIGPEGEQTLDQLVADVEAKAELQRIADAAEAERFAAELERDAGLGSHADWPDL